MHMRKVGLGKHTDIVKRRYSLKTIE
jgi:hypothetical protein